MNFFALLKNSLYENLDVILPYVLR